MSDGTDGVSLEGYGEAATAGSVTTADPRVDAVLASLAPLDSLPVSEHVAVVESAIAQLRSVLDEAGAE